MTLTTREHAFWPDRDGPVGLAVAPCHDRRPPSAGGAGRESARFSAGGFVGWPRRPARDAADHPQRRAGARASPHRALARS